MTNLVFLISLLLSIILFFWGIAKAIKTQKVIYSLAFLPFIFIIIFMFIS